MVDAPSALLGESVIGVAQPTVAANPGLAAYPYDCVCYILTAFPDGTVLQGSGAIIGAHTVLTASHMLWDAGKTESANGVLVVPAFGAGGEFIPGPAIYHGFKVNDFGGKLTRADSQQDFAIIDFGSDLSKYGSFGAHANYPGGAVHMTGYPDFAFGALIDRIGSVLANPFFATLDYISVSPSPGDSGGPLWIDPGALGNLQPAVVGVVSTDAWAVQLTASDWSTINGWEAADSFLWTTSGSVIHASAALPFIQAGPGSDTIFGWSGDDTLFGGDGADSIAGGQSFNLINGNKGPDTIIGQSTVGDTLLGGKGYDLIDATASTAHNSINGNRGNDTVIGGNFGDTLHGGQGDDVIQGGSGADLIFGDLGANTITGGAGADTFHSGAGLARDVITDFRQSEGDRIQIARGLSFTLSQEGADAHIDVSNGDMIILRNTQLSSLSAGWIFQA